MSVSSQSLSLSDLPFVNVTAPGFTWDDPVVVAAREQCWAARTPLGVLVLRYAEVAELLRDPRLVPDLRFIVERAGVTSGPLHEALALNLLSLSGADHRRVRGGLVSRQFTASRVAEVRPFIRTTAQLLTERLAAAGPCDFVEAFADLLPLTVICRLLGIPLEDYDLIRPWAKDADLVLALDYDPGLLPRLEEATLRLADYIETLIRERAADPGGDDVLCHLLRARRDGVLDDELQELVLQLVVAGSDTTSHQLSLAMVAFARHPEQWTMLQEHPEWAEQAVDEVQRWCPTVTTALPRAAAEDLCYQGLHIPAKTTVYLGVHSAHRDPRVFPDGDIFDIGIKRKAPLLAFGGGPHYCPGAMLARTELTEALTVLTTCLGPPHIAGPITWRPPFVVAGPETLPLRFGRPSPAR